MDHGYCVFYVTVLHTLWQQVRFQPALHTPPNTCFLCTRIHFSSALSYLLPCCSCSFVPLFHHLLPPPKQPLKPIKLQAHFDHRGREIVHQLCTCETTAEQSSLGNAQVSAQASITKCISGIKAQSGLFYSVGKKILIRNNNLQILLEPACSQKYLTPVICSDQIFFIAPNHH